LNRRCRFQDSPSVNPGINSACKPNRFQKKE
jgi:hypothetical protein